MDSGNQAATDFNVGQGAAGLTAALLIPARNLRTRAVKITNSGPTADGFLSTIYIGKDNTVSATTGYPLAPGDTVVLNSTANVWAIADAAGVAVAWFYEEE